MPLFEIKDSFSLKSQQYLLKTTADSEKQVIKFVYFRRGEAIYTTMRSFERSLDEEQVKQLASNYHGHFKKEIAKLFQLVQSLRQHKLRDEALDLMAQQFMKYGMNLEAIAFITPFLNKNGTFSQVRFTLGKAYLAAENFDTAREQFRQILSTHHKYADANFYLGLCEYNREDCTAAFGAFTKAVDINPHYGQAYWYLGLTLLMNAILGQEYDLALDLPTRLQKIFQKAVAFLPQLDGNAYRQGLQHIEKEENRKAFDILAPLAEIITTRKKTDFINFEFHLKAILEPDRIKPEDVWQEIQRLQKIAQKHPDFPDLQFELGFAYTVLGASITTTSLSHFQKATHLNPDYRNALKGAKFIQNDQRGYHTLLRALAKAP